MPIYFATLDALVSFKLTKIVADLDEANTSPGEAVVTVQCGDWAIVAHVAHYRSLQPPAGGWDAVPVTVPATVPVSVPANVPNGAQPDTQGDAPGTDSGPDGPALCPMAADALEAADGTWRTSQDLAIRAGWSYGGRWRGVVCKLIREGLLERNRRKELRRPVGSVPSVSGRPVEHTEHGTAQ